MYFDPPIVYEHPEHPSPAYMAFWESYLTPGKGHSRGQGDPDTYDALQGAEREMAARLVIANLDRGRGQFVRLAAHARIRGCIPGLRALFPDKWFEKIDLAEALVALDAVTPEELASAMEGWMDRGDELLRSDVVDACWWMLPPTLCGPIVRRGLCDTDVGVRCSAYVAVVGLETVVENGWMTREWASQIRHAIIFESMPETSPKNWRFHLGRETHSDPGRFASRLTALENRLASSIERWSEIRGGGPSVV